MQQIDAQNHRFLLNLKLTSMVRRVMESVITRSAQCLGYYFLHLMCFSLFTDVFGKLRV